MWDTGGSSYGLKKKKTNNKNTRTRAGVTHTHAPYFCLPRSLSTSPTHTHKLAEQGRDMSCYHQHFHLCPRQTVPVSPHVLNDSQRSCLLICLPLSELSYGCGCVTSDAESLPSILIPDALRCNQSHRNFPFTDTQLLSYPDGREGG